MQKPALHRHPCYLEHHTSYCRCLCASQCTGWRCVLFIQGGICHRPPRMKCPCPSWNWLTTDSPLINTLLHKDIQHFWHRPSCSSGWMKKHAFMSIFFVGHQRIILTGVLPIDLGIISATYPQPPLSPPTSVDALSSMATSDSSLSSPALYSSKPLGPCGCLMWGPPPTAPTQIPFPPTPENREKLQEWLHNHFASSAFNVCEHQQLPQMTGQPMTCHFCPNVEPKAFTHLSLCLISGMPLLIVCSMSLMASLIRPVGGLSKISLSRFVIGWSKRRCDWSIYK